MTLLDVEAVDVFYGDFQALYGLSLHLEAGETLAVVGANGAGKSTLLKTIAGLMRPRSGQILFEGTPVEKVAAYDRVRLGIALTPEGRRLFPSLTVRDNLLVGATTKRPGPWDLDAVCDLFPLVAERLTRTAAHLSGGEQQAVAISRSLLSNPKVLILDEVSLGLAPVVVAQLYAALPRITGAGTTVLLVEQDVGQALLVADRVQCLLEGRTQLEGSTRNVTREAIAAAYFGA